MGTVNFCLPQLCQHATRFNFFCTGCIQDYIRGVIATKRGSLLRIISTPGKNVDFLKYVKNPTFSLNRTGG
jgi:hypothetical protein